MPLLSPGSFSLKIAVERLKSGLRPLFSRGKWICRFHQADEKRSRSSTRASLSRLASASQLSGEERRPRLIAHPFRRDRHPVPAQRHHRSGATATPFRRVWAPVWSVPGGRNEGGRTGRPGFQPLSAYFMIDFNRKCKLTGAFAPATTPFSCP